ncbi:hypothetical protein F2Q69_00024726 [Brassica cretica]|uniref:Uncharacterized protein n=1 Tax=Brassica cretica TaxID=69181 RepID=A0A8S9QBZ4_BRACR|nr:hypothetical protein F2Q69_00024726 [Brassica cretica]
MATCSDGSEHCPHRSFVQSSQSKKSDRNQKYVDDSSPKTSLDSISRGYSAHIGLSKSLRSLTPRGVDVSTQQQGLAEVYPYLMHPSWLHDESSRKQSTRNLRLFGADRSLAVAHISLAVTRLGTDRSLAVAHISLLAELTCRLSAESIFL